MYAFPGLFRKPRTLKSGDRLMTFDRPIVMGIINITPDSFFDGGATLTEAGILAKASSMLEDGAAILDIGACSTRPGSAEPDEDTERERLMVALPALRREFPDAILSIDTFRSKIANWAVGEFGVQIINDISGGQKDPDMFNAVGKTNAAYVLMHMKGNPLTMQENPQYTDLVGDICLYLAERIRVLQDAGITDIIIDPGFGFGKTLTHNYALMSGLDELKIFELPVLVGISRKSMIYRALDCDPQSALNGTTALHAVALLKGADILRTHDVKEAVECVRLIERINNLGT